MSFVQYVDAFGDVIRANLPVAVGGGVAIAVLSYLFVKNRTRREVLVTSPAVGSSAVEEKATHWAPPEQSYADRRGSVRREGAPVRVMLSSTSFRSGTTDGYVVDRSTGGLRIILQTAMAPGSTVQVRTVNAPDTIGFITVLVRSCRKDGDHFVLGCEFEKTPPWNVLLLFG